MKLPNSYSSAIKLGGKRRKPYVVRISKLVEADTGKVKRKYTYLAYFSKPEIAYIYLAEYNSIYNHKSQTTIASMRAVLKAMYQYAKLNEYIDRDLTEGLVYE